MTTLHRPRLVEQIIFRKEQSFGRPELRPKLFVSTGALCIDRWTLQYLSKRCSTQTTSACAEHAETTPWTRRFPSATCSPSKSRTPVIRALEQGLTVCGALSRRLAGVRAVTSSHRCRPSSDWILHAKLDVRVRAARHTLW